MSTTHRRGINYEYNTAPASQSQDNSHGLLQQPLISSAMNQSFLVPINSETAYIINSETAYTGQQFVQETPIVYSQGSSHQQQNNPQKEIDDATSLIEKLNKPSIVGRIIYMYN